MPKSYTGLAEGKRKLTCLSLLYTTENEPSPLQLTTFGHTEWVENHRGSRCREGEPRLCGGGAPCSQLSSNEAARSNGETGSAQT